MVKFKKKISYIINLKTQSKFNVPIFTSVPKDKRSKHGDD